MLRIREHPDDFIVEELATVESDEQGDHLLLFVEATDLDHHSMVMALAKAHSVDRRAVGWAGMKDKRAVTRQWVTIKTDTPPVFVDTPSLKVKEALRTNRRRRPGGLLGNRFEITVRGVDPALIVQVMPRLRTLATRGLPNRFGPQRFGHRGLNPMLGRYLLKGDCESLLRDWLGQSGPQWSPVETPRRQLFDQGRFEEALQFWPVSWNAERKALAELARSGDVHKALHKVPGRIRSLWVDALQSELFNEVLTRREAAGTLELLGAGDIVSVFTRFHDFVGDTEGPDRTATGPMFGRKMRPPGADVAAVEHAVLADQGLDESLFNEGPNAPGGARRPLLVPVLRAAAESGVDDRGSYLRLNFALPRGAYATTVLDALGLELD